LGIAARLEQESRVERDVYTNAAVPSSAPLQTYWNPLAVENPK